MQRSIGKGIGNIFVVAMQLDVEAVLLAQSEIQLIFKLIDLALNPC